MRSRAVSMAIVGRLDTAVFLLVGAFGPAAEAQPPCAVEGAEVDLRGVTVRPPGHASFAVDAHAARVVVTPTERWDAEVSVETEVLSFGARARVALRPARTAAVMGGAVALGEDARVVRYRRRNGAVAGWVDLGIGVTVSVPALPCDALRVDQPYRRVMTPPETAPGTPRWVPRKPWLVFASPRAPRRERFTVHARFPEALPLEVVRRRGKDVLVHLAWPDGSRITGWTRLDALRPATSVGFGGSGVGGLGGCGYGTLCGGPSIYCGPATVAEGTAVHAAPGRGRWATTVSDREVQVRVVRGSGWALLTSIPSTSLPGTCGSPPPAWVPEDAVSIGRAPPPPP
jgi:hypothetical protein